LVLQANLVIVAAATREGQTHGVSAGIGFRNVNPRSLPFGSVVIKPVLANYALAKRAGMALNERLPFRTSLV